ncbi:GNAT family N-acetyltransferase [Photobacterium sp. TLY01]|uniref:GNAT family N-acetyltransferase n=1 Tax=Photobacterium sp. TLY01 TaxID=2907534 RepID=UPI001F42B73C|nr:GNAT family N-acetyltransferase [Photobacterium sp. TLY01]UIP29185.1 GNAT family N-acetyltransferase [Photobacterium sp. TLY01]
MDILVKHIEPGNREHKNLFESLFREYLSSFSVAFEPAVIEQLFALPYFHGFMSFIDSKPAGFAVCFESFSTYRMQRVMNIHDFMVSNRCRGQVVGKTQLHAIEQYCRDNHYLKITTGSGR